MGLSAILEAINFATLSTIFNLLSICFSNKICKYHFNSLDVKLFKTILVIHGLNLLKYISMPNNTNARVSACGKFIANDVLKEALDVNPNIDSNECNYDVDRRNFKAMHNYPKLCHLVIINVISLTTNARA